MNRREANSERQQRVGNQGHGPADALRIIVQLGAQLLTYSFGERAVGPENESEPAEIE